MGTKYEIAQLRKEALTRLTYEFPSSLEHWDKTPSHFQLITNEDGILFDVVQLARQNNVLAILPAAFYAIAATHEIEEVLDGVRRWDGSLAMLSVRDQKTYVKGVWELMHISNRYNFTWLDNTFLPYEKCTTKAACNAARSARSFELLRRSPRCGILEPWHETLGKDLCTFCRGVGKESHQFGREEAWLELPAVFGLPPWHELTT